jgi:hypothetical protein
MKFYIHFMPQCFSFSFSFTSPFHALVRFDLTTLAAIVTAFYNNKILSKPERQMGKYGSKYLRMVMVGFTKITFGRFFNASVLFF